MENAADILRISDCSPEKRANAHKPHIAFSSGNNEWYTPKEYIDAAREVMGGIDLDPASSEYANRIVQAKVIYTIEDNGIAHDWYGRVWLNPPYASKLITLFVEKLKKQYQDGNVEQAIVLVNNATETSWFNTLVSVASAIVFPKSRVKYYQPDGGTGTPLQGQAVVYLGNERQKFVRKFKQFGWRASISEK